jgi:hypothetical protein
VILIVPTAFGDVCIGDIGPRAGLPTTVDQWEWDCGFVPPWRNLRTAFTDDDFAEYRYARAWTAWKQRMWKDGPQDADANAGWPLARLFAA